MAIQNALPDPGLPYHAALSASGGPAGGSYQWTTNSPSMIQFDNSSGANVNVTVSTSGKATITVAYTDACGASGQDSLTFVLTNDITVIGWVDANGITLPTGSSLVPVLNNPALCGPTLFGWQAAGKGGTAPLPAGSSIDRQYANAWLNWKSANPTPPSSIDPATFIANKAAYRLFNRFRASYETTPLGINAKSIQHLQTVAQVGDTPEPCSGWQVFGTEGERHVLNGTRATAPKGSVPSLVYQLNEGRIGPVGQAINAYLNHPEDIGVFSFVKATPYIWSSIQFDANGDIQPFSQGSSLQIYPTYSVYRNGALVNTFTQANLEQFVPLDWTSVYVLP